MTDFYLGDKTREECMEEQAQEFEDFVLYTAHTAECALNCEHCHHGSDCYKTCCWCGGVRDGEGTVSMEFVECDCHD